MGIYNLGGGGGAPELQAKEATPLITNAQQIILPDEGYDGLSKVTVNSMPTGALKTPTVNSIGYVSSGVQTAGYLGTSATSGLQLSTQAAKTITPTTYSQTAVASGKYTTGAVTVAGDSDLIASNIRSGVNIFGVNGSAPSAKILSGFALGNNAIEQTVNLINKTPGMGTSEITDITPTWFGIFYYSINGSPIDTSLWTCYTLKDFNTDLYYNNGSYYGSSAIGSVLFGYYSSGQTTPILTNAHITKVDTFTWKFNLSILNLVLSNTITYQFVVIGR